MSGTALRAWPAKEGRRPPAPVSHWRGRGKLANAGAWSGNFYYGWNIGGDGSQTWATMGTPGEGGSAWAWCYNPEGASINICASLGDMVSWLRYAT